ncbi:MAG: aminotransferase class I/II-fold pyridoxal phosphate-dependent enzyme [Steroidobacteraceae bacterium]
MLIHGTRPHPETLVSLADRGIDTDADVAPPIHQSATFAAAGDADFAAMASTARHPRYYTRDGNPTTRRAESVIAALEGAQAALLTASGMGAISTTLISLLAAGDHLIAQKTHYMGTTQLLGSVLAKFGVEVTLVEQTSVEAFARALRPTTKLIYLESPANPLLSLTDLAAVAALARGHGALSVCDSTIASPVNQQPIGMGVDLVVHSATKFLGGHHDLMAGVIAGSSELIERIWHTSVALGPVPDPMAAWLLLRGLRTLPLRIARQNDTALKVAAMLAAHPAVSRVYYPGLPDHPQHALARSQMPGGFGGLLSFELKGGFDAGQAFINALSIPARAVSFGGFESLATQPAAMWAGSLGVGKAQEAGIAPGLIRFSVGLEHPDDLIGDLRHAIDPAVVA